MFVRLGPAIFPPSAFARAYLAQNGPNRDTAKETSPGEGSPTCFELLVPS